MIPTQSFYCPRCGAPGLVNMGQAEYSCQCRFSVAPMERLDEIKSLRQFVEYVDERLIAVERTQSDGESECHPPHADAYCHIYQLIDGKYRPAPGNWIKYEDHLAVVANLETLFSLMPK
jgi:hypothetical protein